MCDEDLRFRSSEGARDRIRTYGLPLRRRTLYPLSYAGGTLQNTTSHEVVLSGRLRWPLSAGPEPWCPR